MVSIDDHDQSTVQKWPLADRCRGAGGKNADLTSSLVQVCQETIGIECCMHLCCTESEYKIYIVRCGGSRADGDD